MLLIKVFLNICDTIIMAVYAMIILLEKMEQLNLVSMFFL